MSPGISPYKISKDLEEKAKEAKLKREQLDSILPLYRSKVEILKSHGIDKFNVVFKNIDSLYGEKKYVDAYDELIRIKDDVDKEVELLRKNLLGEEKKFIEKLSSMGFADSSILKGLENAPEEIDKFLTFQNDFNKKLTSEIKNSIDRKISLLSSEAKLKILRTYGKQIDSIASLKKDELLSLLETIKKEITEYHMQKINIEMERMDRLRTLFEKMKLGITNFKNVEEKALNAISAENYDDAIKTLRDFNDLTEVSVKRILGEIISNLNRNIEEAKFLGIDTKNFASELKKLEDLFNSGNYSSTVEMIKALSINIEESKIKLLSEKLEQVKKSIQDLKNEGIDVSEFLKSIEMSRNLISSKKFTEAMKQLDLLLKQSKLIIEQKNELLKAVEDFTKNAKEFSRLGISINTDYLEKMRKMAFEDPAKAKAEFEKYFSNIGKKIERSRTDYREQMKEIVTVLKEMGVSTAELAEILAREMEGYAFLIRINEFRDKLLEVLKKGINIDRKFENQEYFNREIKPVLESINDDVLRFDFSSALSSLKRLRDNTMNLKDVFISEKIKNTRKIVSDLNSLGLDLKVIISDLDALEQEKQETAENKLNIVSSLEKLMVEELTVLISPREEFANVVQKNIEIRNLKLSTEIITRRLYDLKSHINSNDYVNSIKIAMDLENASKGKMSTAINSLAGISFIDRKLMKFIPNAAKYFDELKESTLEDYDSRFRDFFGRIDQLYSLNSLLFLRSLIRETSEIIEQTGLFQDRKNLLEMKNVDIVALEPLYLGLEKLRNEFREKVYGRILDIYIITSKLPVRDPSQKLNEAMDEYLDGRYLESWKKLTAIENYVSSISKDYDEASKILNDIEGRINFFINIGLKLEKSEKILDDLRSLILRGDFQGFRESYRSLYLTIKEEIYTQVDMLLGQIEKSVKEKKGRVNTLISEGLISSARRILKLDNAVEAVKQGLEALENIQDYQFLKNISDNLIKRMKISIEKFGTQVPREFTSGFEHVQVLLHQGKYTMAVMEMNNLLAKYEELAEKIVVIKKKIEELREKISVGVLLGVKTQTAVDLFQRARSSFQSMDIDGSLRLLDDAIREISMGIEKILGIYINSIEYLEKIAAFLGISIKNVTLEISDLAKNVIEFSFKRNGKNRDTITNVSNALKSKLDSFEKLTVQNITNELENKLKQLEDALSAAGRENKNDVEFVRNAWSRKLYPIVMDALPIIEYKITKFYVIHMIDYSRDAFTDITDKIVFSGKPENNVINSFKVSEVAGDLEFNGYVKMVDRFRNDLERDINENFSQKIAALKKDFVSIDPIEISNLNEFLLKKDYRSLEANLVRARIVYGWISTINNYLASGVQKIKSRISELESLGYDTSEEKRMLNELSGKGFAESALVLSKINDILSKKEEMAPVSFTIKIHAKIGRDEIPGKISINYEGKIALKNVVLELSGSLEKISMKLDRLMPGQAAEINFSTKPGNGNALEIKILYPWGNRINEIKKSALMVTKIERGFTKKKATGEEKCNLCRGKIFKDLDMVICSKCGSTYHYQCAQRVKKCISCGNAFDFAEEKDVEVSLIL